MNGDPLPPPCTQVTTTTGAQVRVKGSPLGAGIECAVNREVTAQINVDDRDADGVYQRNVFQIVLGSITQVVRQSDARALLRSYAKWENVKFLELGERLPVSCSRPVFATKLRWTANSLSPSESLFGTRLDPQLVADPEPVSRQGGWGVDLMTIAENLLRRIGLSDTQKLISDVDLELPGLRYTLKLISFADLELIRFSDKWASSGVTALYLIDILRRAVLAIGYNGMLLQHLHPSGGIFLSKVILGGLSGYLSVDSSGELEPGYPLPTEYSDMYSWATRNRDTHTVEAPTVQLATRLLELIKQALNVTHPEVHWDSGIYYDFFTRIRVAVKVLLHLEDTEHRAQGFIRSEDFRQSLTQIMAAYSLEETLCDDAGWLHVVQIRKFGELPSHEELALAEAVVNDGRLDVISARFGTLVQVKGRGHRYTRTILRPQDPADPLGDIAWALREDRACGRLSSMTQGLLMRENHGLTFPEKDATYAPSKDFEMRECLSACGIDTSTEPCVFDDVEDLVEFVVSKKVKNRGRSFTAKVSGELVGVEVSDRVQVQITVAMTTDPDSKLFPYGANVFEFGEDRREEGLKVILLRDHAVRQMISRTPWLERISAVRSRLPKLKGLYSNLLAEVVAVLAREADDIVKERGRHGCLITALYGVKIRKRCGLVSDARMMKRAEGTLIVDETIPLEMRLTVADSGRAYGVLAGKQVVIDKVPRNYSRSFISHITASRDPDISTEAREAKQAPGTSSGVHRLRLA